MELHHITGSGNAQTGGKDGHATGDDGAVPDLLPVPVVGALVHQRAVHRALVFRPLLLDVDQGPLAAAEPEVL